MSPLSEDRQVLVNLEINKRCQLTHVCGNKCFLNIVEQSLPNSIQISPHMVMNAAREVIDNGQYIRHLAIVGKEPLDTPDLLLDILRYYHSAPEENRPGKIGIITSGLQLNKYYGMFERFPIDWCAVSLDTNTSGLHIEHANERLLHNLLTIRRIGGTKMALVNSVFAQDNQDAILKLGRWACEAGVDQWALSSMMMPVATVMRPVVCLESIKRFIDQTIYELSDTDCQVLFELELDQFQEITGLDVEHRWRVEHNVPDTNIWLIAANFDRGYFVRLRWDGQLLTKQDFRQLGLRTSTFGAYYPGRLQKLLQEFHMAAIAETAGEYLTKRKPVHNALGAETAGEMIPKKDTTAKEDKKDSNKNTDT